MPLVEIVTPDWGLFRFLTYFEDTRTSCVSLSDEDGKQLYHLEKLELTRAQQLLDSFPVPYRIYTAKSGN